MNAEERWAIVTGASRGIGLATALTLARRGLSLTLLARSLPELETACRECRAVGAPRATALSLDFRDCRGVEEATLELAAKSPPPEVLIHSAGVIRRDAVEELSLSSWQEQIDVNLTAPFLLTRAFLPSMLRAKRGRIVFVASISSTLGTPRQSAYAASKWAVLGFMKSLAEEFSGTGLMTAAVLPGSVRTEMLEGSGFEPRMEPDDVARTLEYLALDAPLSHNGASVEMFGI